MKSVNKGGGWPAVWYTLRKAREVGGIVKLWKAMRSKNACKTCALGMGGQAGGMVNEAGHFPEVCKKSLQAMVSDMQGAVREQFFETYSVPQLQAFSPRELEACGRLTTPLVLEASSQYYRPIAWDDGTGADRRQADAGRADGNLLVLQRPQLERGRLSAATVRPAVRHQQRQQLQLLLPPGQRRRSDNRRRQRHGDGHAGRRRAGRPGFRHRRQSGQQPSAADAHADAGAPPRRPGDRHQSGGRNRPGQLQRAQRRAEPAVRHQDRQPVRAAAHRRRSGAADRHRQTHRSSWARPTQRFLDEHCRRLARACEIVLRALSWDEIVSKSGVAREQIDDDRPALRRGARASSSAGRWASRTTRTAWKTCRRSPTWPCCAAWSAGRMPACCRFAATRTCRASARSA